jgi:hypothetical protein
VQHQLSIHLDFVPGPDGVTVVYSYAFSGDHELREHRVQLLAPDLDRQFADDLDLVYREMIERIGPVRVAVLPHAPITPQIKPAILTIVVQDQRRKNDLPLARMYYNEVIEEIQSQKAREVRANKTNFSSIALKALARITSRAKGMAWADYSTRVAPYLKP